VISSPVCRRSGLARALAGRDGVRAIGLPFDIATTAIAQFWHERYQRDEGHQWLRALTYDLFHDHRTNWVS